MKITLNAYPDANPESVLKYIRSKGFQSQMREWLLLHSDGPLCGFYNQIIFDRKTSKALGTVDVERN